MMKRGFVFPLLVVVLLAALVLGIGAVAYNASLAQGYAWQARVPVAAGQAQAAPYGYYGVPVWRPFFGFGWFGPLGCLIPLFFLFLFFFLLRGPFWFGRHYWRRQYWRRHYWGDPEHPEDREGAVHGPGHAHSRRGEGEWREGMQAMFDEFHRRAHDQPAGEQPGSEAGEEE